MQKGIKFRIYPNREQQNLIHQTFGCCRLIYNKALAMRKEAYENGDKIGYAQTSAMLTGLKTRTKKLFTSAIKADKRKKNGKGKIGFYNSKTL